MTEQEKIDKAFLCLKIKHAKENNNTEALRFFSILKTRNKILDFGSCIVDKGITMRTTKKGEVVMSPCFISLIAHLHLLEFQILEIGASDRLYQQIQKNLLRPFVSRKQRERKEQ